MHLHLHIDLRICGLNQNQHIQSITPLAAQSSLMRMDYCTELCRTEKAASAAAVVQPWAHINNREATPPEIKYLHVWCTQ